MNKRELIDEILHFNQSAAPEFLAQFSPTDLHAYLDRVSVVTTRAPRPRRWLEHSPEVMAAIAPVPAENSTPLDLPTHSEPFTPGSLLSSDIESFLTPEERDAVEDATRNQLQEITEVIFPGAGETSFQVDLPPMPHSPTPPRQVQMGPSPQGVDQALRFFASRRWPIALPTMGFSG